MARGAGLSGISEHISDSTQGAWKSANLPAKGIQDGREGNESTRASKAQQGGNAAGIRGDPRTGGICARDRRRQGRGGRPTARGRGPARRRGYNGRGRSAEDLRTGTGGRQGACRYFRAAHAGGESTGYAAGGSSARAQGTGAAA